MQWQIELADVCNKHIILVVTDTAVDVQGATLLKAEPLEISIDEGDLPWAQDA